MNLRERAEAWMAEDPDPVTRAATAAILDNPQALRAAFGARLQFGTAGLRGPIGPGPNAMNRVTVQRVTAGLAAYLQQHAPGGTVVVGFDGRHGSRIFASDTARVLGGAGYKVVLFDEVCPTPTLAHAVVYLGGVAGVMVTASHNPPQDNGYKVYWGNGAQIIPPHDTGISAEIDSIESITGVHLPELADLRSQGIVTTVPPEVGADYLAQVLALRVHAGAERRAHLKIVYSAMHGVGTASVTHTMRAAGYSIHPVPEQAEPDGDFPTVSFPNPEEPGALDLATALAGKIRADLVVANDPDADRLAVVIPEGKGWRPLSGNQVGCLLAEDLLQHGPDGRRLVATTIVSSGMLRRIAVAYGVDYIETLTGFKWIANAAIAHDAAGGRFVIGFEEALGYSAGPVVRDKDGVSAILLFCDLAAYWKNQGKSILDALKELYKKYGLYASKQVSIKAAGDTGAARIKRIMSELRAARFDTIGGLPILRTVDVLAGTDTNQQTGKTTVLDLPPSNVLAWHLNDGSRILARPSGTEPKIKFYFEVVERFDDSDTLSIAEDRASQRLCALEDAFQALLPT